MNLKHAWDFAIDENVLLSDKDYNMLAQINKLVLQHFFYNAGEIRKVPVNIGGTSWKTTLPELDDVKNELSEIINSKISDIDKAIELVLYIMKKQFFVDGNKRGAIIFVNKFFNI